VALIGIDNDPLTRTLTRVPLSSVIQGTETMGRTAAALLHQMLHGKPCAGTQILAAGCNQCRLPACINPGQSPM
jgi:LacI family transcriptional regulator